MEKKTIIIGWILVLCFIIILVGVNVFLRVYQEIPKVEIKQLQDYQNTYLGDSVKVRNLLELLPYANQIQKIELQTTKQPYRLSIYYQIQKEKEELLYSSFLLYSLIPNVEEIEYQMLENSFVITKQEGNTQIGSYTLENAQAYLNNQYIKNNAPAYQMTMNREGKPVFIDNHKALQQIKKDYSKGLAHIQKEFNLFPFNFFNYKSYKTYGWQVTNVSEETASQARKVTALLDIYENSYQ